METSSNNSSLNGDTLRHKWIQTTTVASISAVEIVMSTTPEVYCAGLSPQLCTKNQWNIFN